MTLVTVCVLLRHGALSNVARRKPARICSTTLFHVVNLIRTAYISKDDEREIFNAFIYFA